MWLMIVVTVVCACVVVGSALYAIKTHRENISCLPPPHKKKSVPVALFMPIQHDEDAMTAMEQGLKAESVVLSEEASARNEEAANANETEPKKDQTRADAAIERPEPKTDEPGEEKERHGEKDEFEVPARGHNRALSRDMSAQSDSWWQKSLTGTTHSASIGPAPLPYGHSLLSIKSSKRGHSRTYIRRILEVTDSPRQGLGDRAFSNVCDAVETDPHMTLLRRRHSEPSVASIGPGSEPMGHFDLERLLKDPAGYKGFLQFTVQNHCAENILFYKAVDEFETSGLEPQMAEELYSEYIKVNARGMVNISGDRQKAIVAQIAVMRESGAIPNELVDLIGKAQHDVGVMLKTDLLPRFLRDPLANPWRARFGMSPVEDTTALTVDRIPIPASPSRGINGVRKSLKFLTSPFKPSSPSINSAKLNNLKR